MRATSTLRACTALVVACFVLVVAPMPSSAANPQTEQVAQFKQMLGQLDTKDTTNAAELDRKMAHKWLDEAEVLVANGDEKAAKRRLTRVEFALDLIRAEVNAAQIRKLAEKQEAAAHNAPDTKAKLQAEVEKLRKKKAELQSELSQLQ